MFRRYIRKNRHSSVADITIWTRTHFGIGISEDSIRRYIVRCKHRLYRAKAKPFISSVGQRRRLAWARGHVNWTIAQWKKVLWTDESMFTATLGNLGKTVIRTKEEANDPECYARRVQKPPSIMVWGCMGNSAVGDLHFCTGTINADAYISTYWTRTLRIVAGKPIHVVQ